VAGPRLGGTKKGFERFFFFFVRGVFLVFFLLFRAGHEQTRQALPGWTRTSGDGELWAGGGTSGPGLGGPSGATVLDQGPVKGARGGGGDDGVAKSPFSFQGARREPRGGAIRRAAAVPKSLPRLFLFSSRDDVMDATSGTFRGRRRAQARTRFSSASTGHFFELRAIPRRDHRES